MEHECYNMKRGFAPWEVYLCDSYITHIEVQGATVIYTFADGIMANTHKPDSSYERTTEATCRIEHMSIDDIHDITCTVSRKDYLFGQLITSGVEIEFSQLVDEINKGFSSLEIDNEFYYWRRLYWICYLENKKTKERDKVNICIDGIQQFDIMWQGLATY